MLASDFHPGTETAPADPATRFGHVETWIFDLDNTLYPAHTNLFAQVDVRIRDFVQRLLKTSHDDAQRLQRDYYRTYGTTLRGLMIEHGISPDEFLEYVHDIDHSAVAPDPVLGAAIERLPGRKFIMTNGTRRHAEKTAIALGIEHHFEDIFDIVAAGLLPKPHRETYDIFLGQHGIEPARAAMFEDLARNLAVPHALGMRTVLVVPQGTREVFREAWEMEGRDEPHVEYVTDDLAHFVARLADARAAG
ncbi:pyrimidine 5'-nucleotidase [Prosthecomicrobium hirschii]|uniref:pyrimidine 5'-nucleotidase n=1 Tax=Prosthecodimorpha hirschii TaxID=665126 RepID=UPI00112C539B|nr:pyrimidine 5'-nucleotidase [Prosthecomicrobium hirschii]TPQ50533.1 pyrimidine 5'-nucleotidase [Prosthecomicrobium hirschii]